MGMPRGLAPGWERVKHVKTAPSTRSRALVGSNFDFLAQGGWDKLRGDGGPLPGAVFAAPALLSVPLCRGGPMKGALTLLDGAMGTELARRGVDARGSLFGAEVLLGAPAQAGRDGAASPARRGSEVIAAIHRDHIAAGAQVITAATFRTNARAVARAGLPAGEFPRLSQEAVRLARAAADEANAAAERAGRPRVRVAGSIAPVEDCYRPALSPPRAEALREHEAHARALAAAGCDLLLVETVCARDEGLAAVEACARTGLPVWVAAMAAPFRTGDPSEPARLLDGNDLAAFFAAVREAGAQAALLNCTPCDGIDRALPAAAASALPFGAYAHMGEIDPALAWPAAPVLTPAEYRVRAARWVARGATLVGGCCGTTPAHIEALAALAQDLAGP
jgi:S-methylmethionine-dependent homocysteine/selenocysteine methylase